MTQKIDGVIRIETDRDNSYEVLAKYFSSLSPEQLRIAVKDHNSKVRAQLELLTYKTKELCQALLERRLDIPPATRERETKYRTFLSKGWTITKIALEMGLQKRQVNYDLKALGLQRKQLKK